MKILICFGTRPEAIKMAPVIRELKKEKLSFKICVTAQHREMLDQVLDFFNIQPDYDLSLMKPDQSLNSLSSGILRDIDKILNKEEPELVLVHGDTTTSVMVALAAFHRKIKIAHIEAGLRTFKSNSPFPEEINRQITARLASINFAPTLQARENLLLENISSQKIFVTGNTIVDALNEGANRLLSFDQENLLLQAGLDGEISSKYILVTGHRRENFGPDFEDFCEALLKISTSLKIDIIYPVHLNPKVQGPVNRILRNKKGINLIPPVNYPTMLWLIKNCEFVISDSGGIQEEAPSLGKIVLVTRKVSERMEAVEAGTSILVGTDPSIIFNEAKKLLSENNVPNSINNPFGDGMAAKRIVEILLNQI
ncbi:non-hydrolyzing UDP-N-acetylglucosamine 2-epimerase [Salinimicrobium sp. HB62]|uniref:non-hydrolyzing UDP-N-acetylglucosamine 2-epimerase n=1 Tax=Salinimicrobium sp. HB62 TaxID=3077781 RepID=UPI002D7A0305|nr:UDP-N-acetylglucosamine 2-epimerase (non-hydrolyzing) [Salinimicrobium sp. HB62]